MSSDVVLTEKLNSSQMDAVIRALTQEVFPLQGPPGSGNTSAIIQIVKHLAEMKNEKNPNADDFDTITDRVQKDNQTKVVRHGKNKICVVASANNAADHVLKVIAKALPEVKVLRMGSTRPTDEEVATAHWLPEMMKRDEKGKVVKGRTPVQMGKNQRSGNQRSRHHRLHDRRNSVR